MVYKIDEEIIGSGSQGEVRAATHLRTGQRRAIKRISRFMVRDWNRFLKELTVLKTLNHPNVIKLHEVLEYVQDSKSTVFLVLELVTGSELFDRIKTGCGTSEDLGRRYFWQLLSGVGYCHSNGVCHRDLKPENLLLSDGSEGAELKIADFGLSAAFAIAAGSDDDEKGSAIGSPHSPRVRRLKSVVGSPHYVAPEVTTESVQGYDGAKADVWSAGVLLYAMLVGNLPFGKELSQCPRFMQFRKNVSIVGDSGSLLGWDQFPDLDVVLERISWFFPPHLSISARCLLVGCLHPDASMRISVSQAQEHPWVAGGDQQHVDELSLKMKELGGDWPAPQYADVPDDSATRDVRGELVGDWSAQYAGAHHGSSAARDARGELVGDWSAQYVVDSRDEDIPRPEPPLFALDDSEL